MRRALARGLGLCLAAGLGCAGAGDGPGPSDAEREASRALARADVEAARGQPAEAEAGYRAALAALPDDPRVLAGLVRVLVAQERFEEALVFDDRVADLPESERPPRALVPRERCGLWLGAARARVAGDRAGASGLLDRVAAEPACSDGDGERVRAELLDRDARAAFEAGEAIAAIEGWRAAVAADPSRADLDARLARALLDAGRRREAVAQLGDALARHPDDEPLRLLMLRALGVPGVPGVPDVPDVPGVADRLAPAPVAPSRP